jgi:hypothetical protein
MEGGYCTETSFFYRDILETLNKIQHVVKATEFIGQTSDGKFWKEGIYFGIGLYSLAAEDCMKENLQVKSVLFVIMRSLKMSLSQLT